MGNFQLVNLILSKYIILTMKNYMARIIFDWNHVL